MRKALIAVILTLMTICCAGCSSATSAVDTAPITSLFKLDVDHMLQDEATTLIYGDGWYLLRIGDIGYYIDIMDIPGYTNQVTEVYSGPSGDYPSIGTLEKFTEINVVGLCLNTLYYCIQWEDEDGMQEGYAYYWCVSNYSSGILRIS